MTTPDEKNAIVSHMLVSSFMERVGSLALLSPDIDGPMCGLLAAEILASLHRRVARDKGVSKEAVEELRGAASTAAGNIYESSGMGDAVRSHTKRAGVAPDDAFSDAEKSAASRAAQEAIAAAMRNMKKEP